MNTHQPAAQAVPFVCRLIAAALLLLLARAGTGADAAQFAVDGDALVIDRQGANCLEDPNCFNRIHPDIPMRLRARPGQQIVFHARNTTDFNIDPALADNDPRRNDASGSTVHPVTGPVYIEGAQAGDVLAVTIEQVLPGQHGITLILPFGFISDLHPFEPVQVNWRLNADYATTDAIPGLRIPNAAFPGIVTVLPDTERLHRMLDRERALAAAGGEVSLPEPVNAAPADLCGPGGRARNECLRTFPPREHGGNFDIRHLGAGVTVYLPCYLDGCGLGIGDVHYAQGDGEVSGTAIEMDATVIVRTRVLKEHGLADNVHYRGPARLLDIPSREFYATTGIPVKQAGDIPPDMQYLESAKVAGLENLSKDLALAARNALQEMLNYLVREKGLTPEQAYIVMSVAVDLRIGQVVDAPNVVVTAVLPLDIFVE